MKIRKGFVSNSSSSSFIVIQDGELVSTKLNMERGETEFGWTPHTYYDTESKINFAFIQALSVRNQEWLDMLFKVINEYLGTKNDLKISLKYNEKYNNVEGGHIDHQSSASEGENIEMFESEEKLKTFLFSNKSFIQTGNDNG